MFLNHGGIHRFDRNSKKKIRERGRQTETERDREQYGIYKNMRGSVLEVIPEGIRL